MIRRLDHVAVAVRDTEAALRHFRDRLGLRVIGAEVHAELGLRLTYLDAGNAYVQLVEPLRDATPIGEWLATNGEGLHHICFGVDDVRRDLAVLTSEIAGPLGSGRGRPAGFLPELLAGVRVECTAFDREQDVERMPGWLDGASP